MALTCNDSDEVGVQLCFAAMGLAFVSKTLPPSEGGHGKHFQREEVAQQVIDVAVGVGAPQLVIVGGGDGHAATDVQLSKRKHECQKSRNKTTT